MDLHRGHWRGPRAARRAARARARGRGDRHEPPRALALPLLGRRLRPPEPVFRRGPSAHRAFRRLRACRSARLVDARHRRSAHRDERVRGVPALGDARSRAQRRLSVTAPGPLRRRARCESAGLAPLVHPSHTGLVGQRLSAAHSGLSDRRSARVVRRSQEIADMTTRRDLVAFVAANLVAFAVALVAVNQPWIADLDDVPRALIGRWLPYALALCAGLAVVLAVHLEARSAFLVRHFALYLAVPATLLLARLSQSISNGELGVVYVGLAGALALHALAGLWSALGRLSDSRVAFLVGVTFLAVALMVLPYDRTVSPTASDEPPYLILTQSLVLDHDLDLANDYPGTRYFVFSPTKLPDIHGIHVGDAIYSVRDLGLPVLAVIPFATAGRTGVMAMLCLVGALLSAQLYLFIRELSFDRRVAFLVVGATAFVHPILTYTTQVYPDLITALVFVPVVRLLRRGMLASARELVLASLLTGTLPWLSTRAWFVAVGLGLIIGYAALRPRAGQVSRAVAGAVPLAA